MLQPIKFKKSFFAGLTILCLGLIVFTVIKAAPPDSPYAPGATLSPACSPGSVNCTVSTPAISTRAINATSPLAGGGDLSADRTLSVGGLSSLGTANYLVGVNAGTTAWEYKQLIEGSNITIAQGTGAITISAAGGTTTFLGLTDTPSSYASSAGKAVIVNDAQDALAFGQDIRTSASPAFTGLTLSGLSTAGIVTNTAGGVLGTTASVPIANGGTNAITIGSAGSVSYSTGTAYAFSAVGTSGQAFISGGTGVPTWGTLGVNYGGTGLNTLTQGYIPFGQGTSALGSDSNFFWDDTNNRLGIGTASPASLLELSQTSGQPTTLTVSYKAEPILNSAFSSLDFRSYDTSSGPWTLSYDTTETSILSFTRDSTNGVLYAGSGSNGIIYRCATSTGCDESGDWTVSYDTTQSSIYSLTFDSTNGVIYAGSYTYGGGAIFRCATSTGCDEAGDWTVSYGLAWRIYSLIFDSTNGVIYAGTDNSGIIYRCDTSTGCDTTGDWSVSYDTSKDYILSLIFDSTNGVIYAGSGYVGTIFRCATSTGCDEASDWTVSYNNVGYNIWSLIFDSTNGVLYAGEDPGGDIFRCATSTGCDEAGDWTVSYNTPEYSINSFTLDSTNGVLYAGSYPGGIIYKCLTASGCDAAGDWSVSYDTTETNILALIFDSANGIAYAGTYGSGYILRSDGSFNPSFTTYGQIQALASDTQDLTEDGSLVFSTMTSSSLTESMRIASGLVGIGDSSPDTLLDLLSSSASNTQLTITNTNAGDYDTQLGFQLAEGTNLFTMGVDDSDSDKFKISTTALGTNDRLVIDSNGKVGIGLTTPTSTLSVLGNADFRGSATTTGNFIIGASSWAAPTSTLTVNGSSYITGNSLVSGNATTSGRFVVGTNPTNNWGGLWVGGNSYISGSATTTRSFYGAGNFVINEAGNVGIGTTSPAQKLHVEGQCVTGDTLLPIVERKQFPISNQLSNDPISKQFKNSDIENLLKIKNLKLKIKPIVDVRAGDYVLSLNEETNKIEPHRINGLMDMGVKPVFRLTTESGKTIRTTGNHPYLVKNKKSAFDTDSLASANLTQNSGLSSYFNYSKSNNLVKSFSVDNSKAVEIGGIEPPGPWMISQNPRQAIPTALELYHENVNAAKWTKVADLSEGDEIAVAVDDLTGVKFVKIKRITLLPPEQVYDIEVEGTHNFVANGIIAHNTYINSTDATADVKGLQIAQSGAVSGTGYGLYVDKTGAATTNVGGYFSASGATTNNYGLIVAAGNVGIGTTAPSSLFSVGSTNLFRVDNSGNATSSGNFIIGASAWAAPTSTLTVNGSSYITGNATTSGAFAAGGVLYVKKDTGNVGIGTTAPSSLFSVGSTNLFRVDNSGNATSSGNFIIGASAWAAPTSTLTVNGSSYVTGNATTSGAFAAGGVLYVKQDTGNVGIGLASSGYKLDVLGTASTTDLYVGGDSARTSTSTNIFGGLVVDSSTLVVNGNENRIGIGTAGPARKLDVFQTVSNAQLRVSYDATNLSEFYTDATGDLTISATGGDIKILSENLSVCSGAGCPTVALSAGGNLVVENKIYTNGDNENMPRHSCPTGWVLVPGSATFGTEDFCVMKYEAKQDGTTKNPISVAAGAPWVNVSWYEAKNACRRIGAHLVTEPEWMTIARNIEATTINDLDDDASLQLATGHSDNVPAAVQASSAGADPVITTCALTSTMENASNAYSAGNCEIQGDGSYAGDDNDKGYYLTGQQWAADGYVSGAANKSQLRTHILSNRNVLWDIAGNAWEWTDAQCGTVNWYNSAAWLEWNNANLTDYEQIVAGSTSSTSTNGVGKYYGCAANGNPFKHGGCLLNGANAGAFALFMDDAPSGSDSYLGFRCAR